MRNTGLNALPWSRKGAANVAGVTYQVAVSAFLLACGISGKLPIKSVTPEGSEDVDCLCNDGSMLYVQAKERADGSGILTASEVATIIDHVLPSIQLATNSRFALVTNAHLGSGLTFGDWFSAIATSSDRQGLDNLNQAFKDPAKIASYSTLSRSALVYLPRELVTQTEGMLIQRYGCSPAVAGLIYCVLLQDLGEVAAKQRNRTWNNQITLHLSHVDAIATEVLETVDVQSLDSAIRDGIVEPLDFRRRSEIPAQRFLQGVDATPSHIAADLDIRRDDIMSEVDAGLHEQSYVVIAGPSGSGKSCLLWRSAQNTNWVARKVRLLRLRESDIPELVRWVRYQRPSPKAPILLCSDNLGRPSFNGWPAATVQLLNIPGVYLLGAARTEDFDIRLAATSPRVVEPRLDEQLANSIWQKLNSRGISTVLDPVEAFTKSEKLLMEFLSLLLAGQRMRDIVATQARERFASDRSTERDALRFICSAHILGLSIPAETLPSLLSNAPDLNRALHRLKDEHLLVQNQSNDWIGLHELRSEIICSTLHATPPPTEAQTYSKLLESIPLKNQPVLIQRYGFLRRGPIEPLTRVIAQIIGSAEIKCDHATALCNALFDCETARYGTMCLEAAQRFPDPGPVPLYSRLMYAVLIRERAFVLPFQAPGITKLAKELPPRPPSELASALEQVGFLRITELAITSPIAGCVKWLQAMEGSITLPKSNAKQIWSSHSNSPLALRVELLASLSRISQLNSKEINDFAGPLATRAEELASNHTNGLSAYVKFEGGKSVVTIELMVPDNSANAHDQAVEAARQILSYCPEVDIAEIITREPGGTDYSCGGHRRGYKRISRENLLRPTENLSQTKLLDALRRLLATRFWTDRMRAVQGHSTELLSLLKELPIRVLNQRDNPRRRKTWINQVINAATIHLPPPPVENLDRTTRDVTEIALSGIASALLQLARQLDAPTKGYAWNVATQLREQLPNLREAKAEPQPTLPSIGEIIPLELISQAEFASDLLFAIGESKSSGLFREKSASEDWSSFAESIIKSNRTKQLVQEGLIIERLINDIVPKPEITRLPTKDEKSFHWVTDRWVIWINAENLPSIDSFLPWKESERLSLGFRVYVIGVLDGKALTFLAMQIGTDNLFPIDEKEANELCRLCKKEAFSAEPLAAYKLFINPLIEASRLSALNWFRKESWRRIEDLEEARRLLSVAESKIQILPGVENINACNALIDQVRKEIVGGAPFISEAVFNQPPSVDQQNIWTFLNTLSLSVASHGLGL